MLSQGVKLQPNSGRESNVTQINIPTKSELISKVN